MSKIKVLRIVIVTILAFCLFFTPSFLFGCKGAEEEVEKEIKEEEEKVEELTEGVGEEIKVISPQKMAQILANVEVLELDYADEAARFGWLDRPVSRTIPGLPLSYNVGDIEDFVFYEDTGGIRTVKAKLYYITENVYMWVEVGADIDQKALAQAAEQFENDIYLTDRNYFGEEWSPGVDKDPRIFILHLTGLGEVSGLFGNSDVYTTDVQAYSNQREIIYVNLDQVVIRDDYYLATLAHEFQHMIQWNNEGNEAHWLDEGLAQLAEYLNGFDDTVSVVEFLRQSNTQLNAWVEGRVADDLRYYGASYLFLLYLWERLGDEFIRTLARHPAESLNSINASLAEQGLDLTIDDIFADWIVANYLDDVTIADGRYGYQFETLGPICPRHLYTTLPIQEKMTLPQYTADYIEIEGQGEFSIEFKGTTEVPLIPAEAYSGKSFWWSNRGDDAYMTLTRSFDLSGLDEAILQFWTWYDIQKSADFAYVEVSIDGGSTWEVLGGKQTKYGPGVDYATNRYSGVSGNGKEPQWVMEEMDLSLYVGQEIIIRFEYRTDTWFNGSGFAVDDIAIPELDYTYDAEAGEDDWKGEGFVRTSNVVPQNWALQLISPVDGVTVQQLDVAEDGTAYADITLGDGVKKTTLIIGAMAPVTEVEASYELKITGELTGAIQTEPTSENVLFQDDFSYVCSGWETYNDSKVADGYVDGIYFIEVKVPEWSRQSVGDQEFSDLMIEVDTTQKVSTVDNYWGVICRYQDESNYYIFEISNDGFYTILALVNGGWVTLVDWTESGTINQGKGAANQLCVTCKGDQLSLEINGKTVAEVRDSSFKSGNIGLEAGTFSQGGAMILFDNFVVSKP